jgi:hypothetical protein
MGGALAQSLYLGLLSRLPPLHRRLVLDNHILRMRRVVEQLDVGAPPQKTDHRVLPSLHGHVKWLLALGHDAQLEPVVGVARPRVMLEILAAHAPLP